MYSRITTTTINYRTGAGKLWLRGQIFCWNVFIMSACYMQLLYRLRSFPPPIICWCYKLYWLILKCWNNLVFWGKPLLDHDFIINFMYYYIQYTNICWRFWAYSSGLLVYAVVFSVQFLSEFYQNSTCLFLLYFVGFIHTSIIYSLHIWYNSPWSYWMWNYRFLTINSFSLLNIKEFRCSGSSYVSLEVCVFQGKCPIHLSYKMYGCSVVHFIHLLSL